MHNKGSCLELHHFFHACWEVSSAIYIKPQAWLSRNPLGHDEVFDIIVELRSSRTVWTELGLLWHTCSVLAWTRAHTHTFMWTAVFLQSCLLHEDGFSVGLRPNKPRCFGSFIKRWFWSVEILTKFPPYLFLSGDLICSQGFFYSGMCVFEGTVWKLQWLHWPGLWSVHVGQHNVAMR